jgi:hypothetical protein
VATALRGLAHSGDVEMRELKTKLGNASGVVLERAGGNLRSEFLQPLIQANLRHSHDPLDTILNLATNVFVEVPPEGDKKTEKVCVEGYSTLSRSTFPCVPDRPAAPLPSASSAVCSGFSCLFSFSQPASNQTSNAGWLVLFARSVGVTDRP